MPPYTAEPAVSDQILPRFSSCLFLAGGSSLFLTTNAVQIMEKVFLFACMLSWCRYAVQHSLLPGQSQKCQMCSSLYLQVKYLT